MQPLRRLLWPRLGRSLFSPPLSDPAPAVPDAVVQALVERLEEAAQARLGRSLSIRQVDAGSCNGCELEINALGNVLYDLERFGLRFVASPRHADVLLVTGPLTRNMRQALERTAACTPEPKWVVAAGDCAVDGGIFQGSYAVEGGIGAALPVDLLIPGCPPTPTQLLEGLLALLAAQAPKAAARR
ncbi:NADH-quinone oxidoreductase subunit B family protein [Paeniroseomonas aquatica]|uniref:NADH-quinone oxidoreductase subunit NuoB n=1 Tax=Paeniroseomonas aquatica TaxID=373043 RepID=A0ABT8A8W9_9PROT|nr:NADH-quinone oxidoreductase subunit NuoB [Paeniroseomonas aquatica]MDN3566105.1 NADH-quinone oxidoreductase subunit NuoB [Paeniroseomonas aquatica]